MGNKLFREVIRIAESEGIQDVKVDSDHRGHPRLSGVAGGRSLTYIFSRSPSDRRFYVCVRTDIRRWLRQGSI